MIFLVAFQEHHVIGRLMADVPMDKKLSWAILLHQKTFREQSINGARYFKAVEKGSGRLVGFALGSSTSLRTQYI